MFGNKNKEIIKELQEVKGLLVEIKTLLTNFKVETPTLPTPVVTVDSSLPAELTTILQEIARNTTGTPVEDYFSKSEVEAVEEVDLLAQQDETDLRQVAEAEIATDPELSHLDAAKERSSKFFTSGVNDQAEAEIATDPELSHLDAVEGQIVIDEKLFQPSSAPVTEPEDNNSEVEGEEEAVESNEEEEVAEATEPAESVSSDGDLYINQYLNDIPDLISGLFEGKTMDNFSILRQALEQTDLSAVSSSIEFYESPECNATNPYYIVELDSTKSTLLELHENLYKVATGNTVPNDLEEVLPLEDSIVMLIDAAFTTINEGLVDESNAQEIYKLSDEVIRTYLGLPAA